MLAKPIDVDQLVRALRTGVINPAPVGQRCI